MIFIVSLVLMTLALCGNEEVLSGPGVLNEGGFGLTMAFIGDFLLFAAVGLLFMIMMTILASIAFLIDLVKG